MRQPFAALWLAIAVCLAGQPPFSSLVFAASTPSKKTRVIKRALQDAKREEATLREQAIRIAIDVVREKSKQRSARDAKAQRQLAAARERRLKELYKQGVAKWRQGARQEAVELFQQMVVIDPRHPLVREAQRLSAAVEPRDASARAPVTTISPANVPALEELLATKRLEQDVTIKHAKQALQRHQYDHARTLLERLLAEDPTHREAKQVFHQVELASLKDQQRGLERQIAVDEQRMMNEVARAELITPPPPRSVSTGAMPSTRISSDDDDEALAKFTAPISFDFQDVALSDVLDFFADAANISMVPSPKLDLKSQRVSLRADGLPLGMALKYVMNAQNLAYRVEDGVVLIATPQEFSNEPMETRVFYLHSGLGPFALETSALQSNPMLAMQPLQRVIEQAIGQPSGSKLVIDERSGSLIITNTAENIRKIERLLSRLDTTPIQVLIETRFVELTLTDLEHLGLENVLSGPLNVGSKTASDGTEGPAHQLAKSGGVKFPAMARESEALNFTIQGVLTGTQFEAVLHALKETKRSKTLSAPRVTTLNNQRASIKVVDEFRYPTRYEVSLVQFDINGDGDFEDAGETEFVNVPQDIQKRDVGILLNVTPSVGKDFKTITLVLAPEVSQFSQFRDLGGDVSVPEFTSSQLTTSVAIADGHTAVLGGLMKDSVSGQVDRVPVLGSLPLVGGLFRQHEQSQTRKNLLIFVTARILAPRGPTT